MTSQVLSFTESFPPLHKATQTLMNVDYKKAYHQFMNTIELIVATIAAIATVIIQKWNENDMTERTQIIILNVYTWTREVAVPNVIIAINSVYNAGKKVREVYEVMNSPLFINL